MMKRVWIGRSVMMKSMESKQHNSSLCKSPTRRRQRNHGFALRSLAQKGRSIPLKHVFKCLLHDHHLESKSEQDSWCMVSSLWCLCQEEENKNDHGYFVWLVWIGLKVKAMLKTCQKTSKDRLKSFRVGTIHRARTKIVLSLVGIVTNGVGFGSFQTCR